MILEMIYRNRTKRHVWAKSTKTIFFIKNTKRQNSF